MRTTNHIRLPADADHGSLSRRGNSIPAIVADHANGKITVVDAMLGKIIANYGLQGPARLKANETGRLVFATQGAQNRVDVIDSGVSVTRHSPRSSARTFKAPH